MIESCNTGVRLYREFFLFLQALVLQKFHRSRPFVLAAEDHIRQFRRLMLRFGNHLFLDRPCLRSCSRRADEDIALRGLFGNDHPTMRKAFLGVPFLACLKN